MSRHLDAALRVLEGHDLQHSTEGAMPVTSLCWRCEWASATLDVGLCEACADDLRAERREPDPLQTRYDPYEMASRVRVDRCLSCGGERSAAGHECATPHPAWPDYWLATSTSSDACRDRDLRGRPADLLIFDDPPQPMVVSMATYRRLEQAAREWGERTFTGDHAGESERP